MVGFNAFNALTCLCVFQRFTVVMLGGVGSCHTIRFKNAKHYFTTCCNMRQGEQHQSLKAPLTLQEDCFCPMNLVQKVAGIQVKYKIPANSTNVSNFSLISRQVYAATLSYSKLGVGGVMLSSLL